MPDHLIDLNCPSLRRHPHGRTATGTTPQEGRTAACDPTLKGKRIYIHQLGYRICEDTGAAITGAKIDIFYATLADASAATRSITFRVLD